MRVYSLRHRKVLISSHRLSPCLRREGDKLLRLVNFGAAIASGGGQNWEEAATGQRLPAIAGPLRHLLHRVVCLYYFLVVG